MASSDTTPPFSLTAARYDQSTFLGRCRTFAEITNPRMLFYSQAELDKFNALIEEYKKGNLPKNVSDEELWHARSVIEAHYHPDTGELIPAVFRFSAFVPMNIFIAGSMLNPAVITSVPKTIGIHWFNQSYNAGVNYANRNASSEVPQERLIEGYVGAVTISLTIALGATFLSKRAASLGKNAANIIRATLPFAAVAGAGGANVTLMRRTELVEGVDVYDHEGTLRGKSVDAGKQGLMKCAAARVLWNIPIMVVPPVIMARLERRPLFANNPRLRTFTELSLITAMLFVGVTPALAAFPQRDTIATDKMEPQFKDLRDSKGEPVKQLFFNKGL